MIIDFRLSQIVTPDEECLDFPHAGITCIVGANNVGKSRFLRDITSTLLNSDAQTVTFSELKTIKPIVDEAIAWRFMEEVGTKSTDPQGHVAPRFTPLNGGQGLTVHEFLRHYRVAGPAVGPAISFFTWYASAGSLVAAASGGAGNFAMEGMSHPLARVFRDGSLEQELSDLAQESFNLPLTLDRINGDVRLRVGSVDIPVPPLNRPSLEYANAVRNLPTLDEQGDGIKSFFGLALNVIAGSAQILLIDEPEAFLHPAQARTLGRWLRREAARRNLQVVLATHDKDLLLGLIDSDGDSVVNIVRITREKGLNRFRQLSHDEISAVWKDPVLRYSNVLQGLFHGKVVICESDADCRFYRAVLDQLAGETSRRSIADDILFVPSGGKRRVASMATALTRLGVKTYAIVDFDILRSRSDVIEVVQGIGRQWTDEMGFEYKSMAREVNQSQRWNELKHQGLAGLPAGSAFVAGDHLVKMLRECSILVVPVGEMEDFDKSSNLHGAAWVSQMLESRKHESCRDARDLVEAILS